MLTRNYRRAAGKSFINGRPSAGFSLIEVTLALGIIAFAITPMLCLLPMGLSTARNAIDLTIGSQIMQRMKAEVRETDVALLSGTTIYFDDQGNELGNTSGMLYEAKVAIKAVSLPGGDAGSPHLIQATVSIANNPGHVADPFSGAASAANPPRISSLLVSGTLPASGP